MTDSTERKLSSADIEAYADTAEPGVMKSLWRYMSDRGKWFFAPIIVILLLAGMFLLLAGTGVAPFIYTLF